MPYLNIDDGMGTHPAVEGLSDGAFRLHFLALLSCARDLTDGVVTRRRSRSLLDRSADPLVTELIEAGLWHDAGLGCDRAESIERRTCPREGIAGAYLIHDYLQWNHSKSWWDDRRKKERERKDEYRKKKAKSGKTGTGSGAHPTPQEPVPTSVPAGQPMGQHAGQTP